MVTLSDLMFVLAVFAVFFIVSVLVDRDLDIDFEYKNYNEDEE
jgi:hypothetical protein